MECIVTGITEMRGTTVCMSLYSLENNCYIRPLKNGHNFCEEEISGVSLYTLVDITPSKNQFEAEYPHNEDLNIKPPYFSIVRELTDEEIFDFFDTTAYESTEEIFGEGNLIKQARSWGVLPNEGRCSLGAVEVEEYEIFRDNYDPSKPKFKVDFTDVRGKKYQNVALVMKAPLEEKIRMEGHYTTKEDERIFLRLSLARPFQATTWDEEMCTLQVSSFEHFDIVNV